MSEHTETWKPVIGWDGFYEVSDLGRVRSMDRIDGNGHHRRGKILRPQPNGRGARKVSLCRGGIVHQRLVHQLVLEAFVGRCPDGEESLHGPAGRDDDSLVNLSWGTRSQNLGADKVRDGTSFRGEQNPTAKLTNAIVLEARRRYAAGGVTFAALGAEYGVCPQTVHLAVTRRTWQSI